jgi:ABC-type cobalamin/Fe3+-siderophores transport system ATPase subunit
LDIKIKKGDFVVVIGETGAGKTTLLNSLIGELIYMPDQVIKEIGDPKRHIKDGELRYLEDALLATDLTKNSPISLTGTTGYNRHGSKTANLETMYFLAGNSTKSDTSRQ